LAKSSKLVFEILKTPKASGKIVCGVPVGVSEASFIIIAAIAIFELVGPEVIFGVNIVYPKFVKESILSISILTFIPLNKFL